MGLERLKPWNEISPPFWNMNPMKSLRVLHICTAQIIFQHVVNDKERYLNFQTRFNVNSLFRNSPASLVLGVRKTYSIQALLHRNLSCTKLQRSLQGLVTQKFTIINHKHRYIIFFYLYLRTVLKIFACTSVKNYLVCYITFILLEWRQKIIIWK